MFSVLSNEVYVLNLYPLHSAERPRPTVNKRTSIKPLLQNKDFAETSNFALFMKMLMKFGLESNPTPS